MLRASEPRCPDSRGVDGVRWGLPSVTNVDHIAVRESVVKAVQTLGYDYPTKEQLDLLLRRMRSAAGAAQTE